MGWEGFMAQRPMVQAILVFSPIVALLLVGMVVTVRSGLAGTEPAQAARKMILNGMQLAGALAVCLVGLALLQVAVGFNLALMW
jgi:hypothetical protein